LRPEELQKIYRRQAQWFAGERSRLLRKVDITAKRSVLDLGAGTGEVLRELNRRAGGIVIGLDQDIAALRLAESGLHIAAGSGNCLPFSDCVFDLILTQMFFLWVPALDAMLVEINRVMAPGGHLIAAAEPDYGGIVEHPQEGALSRGLVAKLSTEGADVTVGRKLGGCLERAGFTVECGVHPARPLESAKAESPFAAPEIIEPSDEVEFLFVPYFYFLGRK
jgi:SAM-dependent methyltransferase